MKKYIYFYSIILFTMSCSDLDQNEEPDKIVEPYRIESIKIQTPELSEGFVLFQESLAKPGESPDEQVYQFWRRDS